MSNQLCTAIVLSIFGQELIYAILSELIIIIIGFHLLLEVVAVIFAFCSINQFPYKEDIY